MSIPTESVILFTGLPGSGKSLRAVWLMTQYKAEGVKVYAWGVNGVSPDLCEVLPPDWDFKKWQELPEGSVLFIDEAHKLLPTRGSGAPPPHIQAITEIRHYGLRMVLVTQDPRNVDVFVRRLIGRHYHMRRKMGFNGALIYNFDFCAENPSDPSARKVAITQGWKYPKDLFDKYKSASLHVVKPAIPKKVLLFSLIGIVGLSFVIWTFLTYAGKIKDKSILQSEVPAQVVDPVQASTSSSVSFGEGPKSFETVDDYIEHTKPLLPALPWTAPVYDEIRQVQLLPAKPLCYIGRRGCTCWSEQLTLIEVPEPVCESIVRHGIYSPYHAPYATQGAPVAGGVSAVSASPPPSAPAVVLVDDVGVESRRN